MDKQEVFLFYRSFHEATKNLPADLYKEIMIAVMEYALNGEVLELSPMAECAFMLIKPQIDANNRRRENGTKGGRPKTKTAESETEQEPNPNLTETEAKPNHNLAETKQEPPETEPKGNKESKSIKDKVKDKEKVKEKETASGMVLRLTAEKGMSWELRDALLTWVKYKTEKRQGYKPEGLKALIAQVQNASAEYGEHKVISLIADCMASGYQGIIFDKLKKDKPPGKKTKFDNFEGHGTDYDSLVWGMVTGGQT